MSRESDAEFRRQLERELDQAAWKSVRPLFLAMLLVAVSLWAWSVEAATVNLTCTPPSRFTNGTPIDAPLAYRAYWGTSAASLASTAALAGPGCKGAVDVPDAPQGASVSYYFAVTAVAAGLESGFSNVASKVITGLPKQLLTVGGPVYIATPNYTNFTWKLGAPAGTIAPKVKCDVTRKISDDFFRVTAPIVWTAGKKNYVVAKCVES